LPPIPPTGGFLASPKKIFLGFLDRSKSVFILWTISAVTGAFKKTFSNHIRKERFEDEDQAIA
jgi:hypothetical protein